MRKLLLLALLPLIGCQPTTEYRYYPDAKGGIWRVNERGGSMAHCIAEPPRIVCSVLQ